MAPTPEHDPLCPSDLVCNCGQVHRSYSCQCDIIAKVRKDDAEHFNDNLKIGMQAAWQLGYEAGRREA